MATSVTFRPQQSFQHTLKEISVNREDPCELVRELMSNAYDAKAKSILVAPYLQKKGLIFFDNGIGLSDSPNDLKNGIVPYVAFFSIGKTTKTKGAGIGYKCQGSKLCFASGRITVITRCKDEVAWRMMQIDNPARVLNEGFDLTPQVVGDPWQSLIDRAILDPDERSMVLFEVFSKKFFEEQFQTGTLIIIEAFDVQDYGKYFSVANADSSYLYNYLRFYTAHGDVRHLSQDYSGFSEVDKTSVESNRKTTPAALQVLMDPTADKWQLVSVPFGYPYLPVTDEDEKTASPNLVNRLRDGRFCARFATVFDHEGQKFSIIVAVDGKRRALDGYKQLGRQKASGCGIPLSSQRGVILTSHGVRVCSYSELFHEDALRDFEVLTDSTEHYAVFVNGPFELVTNRNSLAPESLRLLKDPTFLDKIKTFFNEITTKRNRGAILRELVERSGQERTHDREEQYQKMMAKLKSSLPNRSQFQITSIDAVKGKWFVEPSVGEEHMVGALYTLFAHIVPLDSPLKTFWSRPLTFSAYGIDAIACMDEKNLNESLQYMEYKHTFSADIEFNHPFSVTNEIICWDYAPPALGAVVQDSYDYIAKVESMVKYKDKDLGFILDDIRLRSGLSAIGHKIRVLSLKRLIENTFTIDTRAATTK